MKTALAVLIGFLATAVAADVPGYTYWSSAALKAYGKKLAPKMDAKKSASESLAKWDNHWTMIAHREGDGEAEVHEKVVDFFIPQEGEATLVVGGAVVEPRNTGPGEVRGKSIQGGATQKIKPGDIIHIPKNTPHQVLMGGAKQFTYFVIKVQE
jgi:mannose-6-phosphate isomerase-like protein (cupin superfamily)